VISPDRIDRSNWQYGEGGPPLEVAMRFVDLIKQPDLVDRLSELQDLVTPESWPIWEAEARKGLDPHILIDLTHFPTKVRYPAPEMAYVFCIIAHPDQHEAFVIAGEGEQLAYANIVTLLAQAGHWRVHQLGEMLNPAWVGRRAYSL
jgi:hypothetical protein